MYRVLKTFYLIFVCLSYENRRKIINVFIILDSHETKIKNVVKAFFKSIKRLDREMKNVEIDKKMISMCVFTLNFIDNMF